MAQSLVSIPNFLINRHNGKNTCKAKEPFADYMGSREEPNSQQRVMASSLAFTNSSLTEHLPRYK